MLNKANCNTDVKWIKAMYTTPCVLFTFRFWLCCVYTLVNNAVNILHQTFPLDWRRFWSNVLDKLFRQGYITYLNWNQLSSLLESSNLQCSYIWSLPRKLCAITKIDELGLYPDRVYKWTGLSNFFNSVHIMEIISLTIFNFIVDH